MQERNIKKWFSRLGSEKRYFPSPNFLLRRLLYSQYVRINIPCLTFPSSNIPIYRLRKFRIFRVENERHRISTIGYMRHVRLVNPNPMPDLWRTDAADVFANTCDQTFFSQLGLTIAYPLPTYENLNLCLSTDPMQLFGDTDRRRIWSENGFPLLKLGGRLCSTQSFSPASSPDLIWLPEILPLHVLGLSFEPDARV